MIGVNTLPKHGFMENRGTAFIHYFFKKYVSNRSFQLSRRTKKSPGIGPGLKKRSEQL